MTEFSLAATITRIAGLALAAIGFAKPAAAQSLLQPITVDATASLASDYRFRGLSLSDRNPAVQGGISISTLPGFFASVWGSTLKDHNNADVEIDLVAGWSGPALLGWVDLSAGVIHTAFVGGDGSATELFASAAVPFGPLRGTMGVNYAPSQGSIGGDNRYLYGTLSAAIPGTAVTLKASAGHEHGGLVTGDSYGRIGKWDWRLGADCHWRRWNFNLSYVGNDLPDSPQLPRRSTRKAGDRAVFTVTYGF